MRWILCALVTFTLSSFANEAKGWEAQSEEEALFLRRIAAFWQEGEYHIVKEQIEQFLEEHPQSSFAETLQATLGDLYVRERNFKAALVRYAHITDPSLADRVFLNRMQCLLELQWHATLADECEQLLQRSDLTEEKRLKANWLLAVALYQQCLNTPPNSEMLEEIATRARPHFDYLLESELASEVIQAFAHLCCLFEDYKTAANAYEVLANRDPANREERLFQAALLQSEYDKKLAIDTFEKIAATDHPRCQEALFNSVVLLHECAQHEELIRRKEEILSRLDEEKQFAVRLYFGRSHLQLKQFGPAHADLICFLESKEHSPSLRTALYDLIEASWHLGDEPTVKKAIELLSTQFPNDPQMAKALFAHALLLKKSRRLAEAREELEALRNKYASAPEKEAALFEQLHLEFQESRWAACRSLCLEYLKAFPKNDLSPFVWRYLASASSKVSLETADATAKLQLCSDLQGLLASQEKALSKNELGDWTFLLARTHYELKQWPQAIALLKEIPKDCTQAPNATLLLALCHRDGAQNLELFCSLAEEALACKADLLDENFIRIALFNAYAKQEIFDKAASHLYAASQKTSLGADNLLWLADYFDGKDDERSYECLQKFLAVAGIEASSLDESQVVFEEALVKLAQLKARLNLDPQELLEALKKQQEANPTWAWKQTASTELLLAETHLKNGREEQALALFDSLITKHPTMRTLAGASAALQSTRVRLGKWMRGLIKTNHPDFIKSQTLLKTLVLQKTLTNEPIHLEAALEYIDLQLRLEKDNLLEKKLALLIKTREEFDGTLKDLLSQDYQNSRKFLPEKDRIYLSYISFIDAEILFCKSLQPTTSKEESDFLKQNAKKLYEEIMEKPVTPFLAKRAEESLRLLGK